MMKSRNYDNMLTEIWVKGINTHQHEYDGLGNIDKWDGSNKTRNMASTLHFIP
jgi:hypothetical protein